MAKKLNKHDKNEVTPPPLESNPFRSLALNNLITRLKLTNIVYPLRSTKENTGNQANQRRKIQRFEVEFRPPLPVYKVRVQESAKEEKVNKKPTSALPQTNSVGARKNKKDNNKAFQHNASPEKAIELYRQLNAYSSFRLQRVDKNQLQKGIQVNKTQDKNKDGTPFKLLPRKPIKVVPIKVAKVIKPRYLVPKERAQFKRVNKTIENVNINEDTIKTENSQKKEHSTKTPNPVKMEKEIKPKTSMRTEMKIKKEIKVVDKIKAEDEIAIEDKRKIEDKVNKDKIKAENKIRTENTNTAENQTKSHTRMTYNTTIQNIMKMKKEYSQEAKRAHSPNIFESYINSKSRSNYQPKKEEVLNKAKTESDIQTQKPAVPKVRMLKSTRANSKKQLLPISILNIGDQVIIQPPLPSSRTQALDKLNSLESKSSMNERTGMPRLIRGRWGGVKSNKNILSELQTGSYYDQNNNFTRHRSYQWDYFKAKSNDWF